MLNHCKWIADAMLQFTCGQGYGLLLINRTKKNFSTGFQQAFLKRKDIQKEELPLQLQEAAAGRFVEWLRQDVW
jgi:hypothetical protein